MDHGKPGPSSRSLRALDALNVVLADVRDGLGPYLAIYLATKHWDPSRIGLAMSAMGAAPVIAQTPAGALIDRTRRKRSWMVAASIGVALGAVAMSACIIAAQVVMVPVALALDASGAEGSRAIDFLVDPTGRHTAVPAAVPAVESTAFC